MKRRGIDNLVFVEGRGYQWNGIDWDDYDDGDLVENMWKAIRNARRFVLNQAKLSDADRDTLDYLLDEIYDCYTAMEIRLQERKEGKFLNRDC